MWWTIAIAMCTTPPQWASMNYEHYNCIMMTTMVPAQERQNHNMIKKTVVINNEELNKILHFCNQSWKNNSWMMNHGWKWTMAQLTILIHNVQQLPGLHRAMFTLHNSNNEPPKEPLPSCIFNSKLWNLAKSQCAMENGKEEWRTIGWRWHVQHRTKCHECKKREATWVWYLNFQWWNLALHHKSSIVEVGAIDANKIQQLCHIRWHSFKIKLFFPFPIHRHLFIFAFKKIQCTKKNFGERSHISSLEGKREGGGGCGFCLKATSTLHFIATAASEPLLLSFYVTKGPTLSGHYALGTEGRTRS
jgi:hypothetical protein